MSRSVSSPLASRFVSTLLMSSLALVVVGCNKKPSTSTTNATSSTSSTTTTTTVSATSSTADSSGAVLAVDSATSATALTTANSATTATSAPATTQVQGNPKDTVKNHIEALRTGNVKNAVNYVQTNDPKAITQFLTKNLPQYKSLNSVKYAEPQFNEDKTQAQVIATFTGKSLPQPIQVPYLLVGTPTGWKILADAPKDTPATDKNGKVKDSSGLMSASEAAALKAGDSQGGIIKDKNGRVITTLRPQQKVRTTLIVIETTKKGTPEDTVKQAMNTLIMGSTKDATKYYISKNPKITDIVANQQALFQQNLQSLKIGETKYNKNKTQADVNVLLIPFASEPVPTKAGKHDKKPKAQPIIQPQPQPGVIKLEKKGGVWKILAD